MSTNLQNSIWPNEGGTLGQIKVQIPDGVNTTWPEGDALVHNFVFNKGKLVGFVDTKALIANDSKTTTFPYDYVNISLPSIAEGEMTYNYDQCAYFILNGEVLKGDVPSDEELEIITKKYAGCKTVDDIKAVDPDYLTNDIVNGVWTEGLGDLEQGGNRFYDGGMFADCTKLTTFTSDLSNLTNGDYMFYHCTNLTTFTSDLSNAINGWSMFQNCTNLTSFSTDLSSLDLGFIMFDGCSKLTSFTSDLSSVTDARHMFGGCKLDAQSVANIVHTLSTYESNGTITIGIGCDNTEADQLLFAQECDCETWQELLDEFSAKNWTVTFQCNGRPTEATTYNMRRGETLPIYAKLEEVTDEKYAQYTSADGSKFYNINYFHSTNGSTEGYDVFSSLEEAISIYNVTPKN